MVLPSPATASTRFPPMTVRACSSSGVGLDIGAAPLQKQRQVSPVPSDLYARCREQTGLRAALRDSGDVPPERLLQAIWQHQRLRRQELQTPDGRPVRVLHPGFPNPEGGPDFRDAFLALGDSAPQRGDVEVDVRAANWRAHGHDRNPRFSNVILHVVWEGGQAGPGTAQPAAITSRPPAAAPPPVLILRDLLDAPLAELNRWLNAPAAAVWPEQLRGRCCETLRSLSAEQLHELLRQAALVRLRAKGALFQARARVAGWEQALWEGLLRALGYKHNVWPMQWLAERRARWMEGGPTVLQLQARLLGLAGLLPADVGRVATDADRHVRRLWDLWWREREALADCALPRTAWHLHGLRPANHPQRRLALAAHWLAAGNSVPAQLEDWAMAQHPDTALTPSLHALLQPGSDEFWSWHWTFRSARLPRPQALLGLSRVTDLALNVVLPWLWQRAVDGGNDTLRAALELRYFAWPAAQDNAVLRLARQRLLGGAAPLRLHRAALQQGLLQIVRDFCEHANALCDGCPFPDLARHWQDATSAPATTGAGPDSQTDC